MNFSKKHALMSGVLAAVMLAGPAAHAEEQTIKVTQLAGSNPFSTAAVINQFAKDNYKTVYIASGNTYSDALAGGVLAGEKDAALLFTDGKKLDKKSLEIVEKADKVYVVGGTATISEDFVRALPKKAERLSGANRYETAASIAETLGTDRDLTIVNGLSYADTLASTALSIKEGRNILLVDANEIHPATKTYLENNGQDVDILFIGGEKSVSRAIKEETFELAGKDKANIENSTIAGANRYETSAKIAQRFDDAKNIIVADGDDYVTALAASTLSKAMEAPVLLTNDNISQEVGQTGLNVESLEGIILLGNDDKVCSDSAKELVAEADGISKDKVQVATVNESGQTTSSDAPTQAPTKTAQTFSGYVADGDLNVRAERNTSSKVLGILKTGEPVKGTIKGDWVEFDYKGKTAYVSKKYLTTEKPEVKTEEAKEAPQKTSKRQAFIDAAVKMEGWSYSQSKRNQDGYSDCSSLILRAMINSGVTNDKSNLTSRSIASDGRFQTISKDDLKPGDILWMSGHLAIYMGEGKTFEARHSTQKVGYSTMGTRFSKYYRIKGL